MTKKSIMLNIVPFNEIFYRKCFYNSLFSVVNYFNGSIISILINDFITYSCTKVKDIKLIDVEYLSAKSLDEVLHEMYILNINYNCVGDLILKIISSISINRPVVLFVDSFYETFRQDAYLKIHIPHALVIYGYDDTKHIFNIIEHENYETLSYKEYIISYEDLLNCYKGYIDNFPERISNPSYYEYYSLPIKDMIITKSMFDECSFLNSYSINILKNESIIKSGLACLEDFILSYKDIFLNEDIIRENIDEVLLRMNNIINAKRSELYKLNKIMNNNQYLFCNLLNILEKIIDDWCYVRAIIAKYLYTSIYKKENMLNTFSKLEQILEDEYKYNNMMFSNLSAL